MNKEKEQALADKDKEILQLNSRLEMKNQEFEIKENGIRTEYETLLKRKQEEVDFYKDFKAKQSTKAIGESLEVYCSNEFNKIRNLAFPLAYFEKGKSCRVIHPETSELIESLLRMLKEKGEKETFRYIRNLKDYKEIEAEKEND